jgi:hypothetical protein
LTNEEKLRRLEATLAVAGNTHTVRDIVDGVEHGRFHWFDNGEGHIVAEINQFPQLRAVNFFLIFGELRHCLALEHEVLPWAIENGCTMATATGRRGWGRVAAPTGWRPWSYNFIKPLVRQ